MVIDKMKRMYYKLVYDKGTFKDSYYYTDFENSRGGSWINCFEYNINGLMHREVYEGTLNDLSQHGRSNRERGRTYTVIDEEEWNWMTIK